jgi:cellulose synthase/poly-beta-1,6-N-acetylglucosamine synthase-like glycosyltransferase
VTAVLTVRNEERVVEARLRNLFDTSFPHDRIDVVVASDGSQDATDAIVRRMSDADDRITLLALEGRGKSASQQHAISAARGDVIVLTDAEASFQADTITNLVRPFADAGVGCSTGRVVLMDRDSGIAASQGLYWRYEMWLRSLESATGLMHTASGQVMAFRKSRFRPFEPEYGDDCVIPLDMLRGGLRAVHVDDAVAFDAFPSSAAGELRARARMTLRNVACTVDRLRTRELLRQPMVWLAIVSHKLLRWLTPFFLILLLASNCLLLRAGWEVDLLLAFQGAFYGLGALGYVAHRRGRTVPIASQVFSFLLANLGFLLGVLGAAHGQQITVYRNHRPPDR